MPLAQNIDKCNETQYTYQTDYLRTGTSRLQNPLVPPMPLVNHWPDDPEVKANYVDKGVHI